MQLNRQQRRASRRARPSLMARAERQAHNALAGLRLLDSARPFDEGDTTEQHIKTRVAFERLKTGAADCDDFDRVAMALNLAKIRAMDIDDGLACMLEHAQGAMTAMRARYGRWSKWDMLQAEREAITEAMDAHEAIADASSPLQMRMAMDVVRRSILKNIKS